MWVTWTLAMGLAQASSTPLTIGGGVGPVGWVGDVPEEYRREAVGTGFALDLGVPLPSGWTTGGGVGVSVFTVGVPYTLDEASRRKDARFDSVTIHADIGRARAFSERLYGRVRGGPAMVAMITGAKGGANVLDCEGDACVQEGLYNTQDDRVVVEEVEKEGPFGWRPGAFVSTGVQWQAVQGEQGLVLSADVFGVVTGRHQRSGLNGSHVGLWLGLALGGPKAD